MNLELMNLEQGNKTAVVISDGGYAELENAVFIKADLSDAKLFGVNIGEPVFKARLEEKKEGKYSYLIFLNIDKVGKEMQDRFVGMIKDREFMGYVLPNNCVIGFTVENKNALSSISKDLYKFCIAV